MKEKVWVTKDEAWPVYVFIKPQRNDIGSFMVDKRTLARWNKAIKEYEKVQSEIRKRYLKSFEVK